MPALGKLLPVLLALAGLGIGAGAGFFLRPEPVEDPATQTEGEPAAAKADPAPEQLPEYAKLNNQFVVPVIKSGRVESLVVLSLSLEVAAGTSADVFTREPKLRHDILQFLFEHSNAGGFDGAFTQSDMMTALNRGLLQTVQQTLGDTVTNVLITDIVRQDG